MKRNQHINVPRGDTRRVEIPITDITGDTADEPTNLVGKTVRWWLQTHSGADEHVIEYTTDDAKLSVEGDPVEGLVSLDIDSTETGGEFDNYRHYFRVEDGEDQWKVATGLLKIE